MKKIDPVIKDIAIFGGGALILYFGVINPLLQSLGIKKTAAEEEQEKRGTEADKTEEEQVLKLITPTKSAGEWKTIADQIYADLRYSALDDNKDDAMYQACRVKNDADFILLQKYFGLRQEYMFGIPAGAKQDLRQFLKSNLSDKQIGIINANYRAKKITYSL